MKCLVLTIIKRILRALLNKPEHDMSYLLPDSIASSKIFFSTPQNDVLSFQNDRLLQISNPVDEINVSVPVILFLRFFRHLFLSEKGINLFTELSAARFLSKQQICSESASGEFLLVLSEYSKRRD